MHSRSTMLNGAAFQSLVLAAVCLASRAVPLRNITSSEERYCDGETPSQTESNTPSPSLDPESARASVFTPEISSERPHSSSYRRRVHDGTGSVTPRWDASHQTHTADGQQDKPMPEDSSLSLTTSATADLKTESSESSGSTDYIRPGHLLERRREDNTSVQEDDGSDTTSLNITGRLLTSVSEHQTLKSRAPDDTDVWTEALHVQREDVSVEPSSQDLLTDATMSSEDLPLIFEPFEDVTPAGNSSLVSRMSVATVPMAVSVEDAELMVSMDTEHTSSLSGMLDWPSSQMQMKATEHDGTTENNDITQMMTVTSSEVPQIPTSRSKTDTEDQESKEETDEDDGMDSDEEESEEDLTETTMTPPNRPPYSLIPPPPVWMQGNHGLVRSWVELIREKAGYVSGMLAPVGIGIAGALLLVGTLYSIRVIHRRRRENIKHQRSRPPREVRSGPDNAMLLADSSEDEF